MHSWSPYIYNIVVFTGLRTTCMAPSSLNPLHPICLLLSGETSHWITSNKTPNYLIILSVKNVSNALSFSQQYQCHKERDRHSGEQQRVRAGNEWLRMCNGSLCVQCSYTSFFWHCFLVPFRGESPALTSPSSTRRLTR